MLKLGEACEDREMVVRSHAYKLREYLELGDIPAVDRELSTYARLAEELRMPQHIWHTFALRAMRAMIDGELEEAEELAGEARRRGERAEQPLATQYYGVQLILLRRFQGRTDELLPAVRELVERYPAIPAWRTALITLEALGGHLEEGRLELERFAGEDFSAIPRDANWLPAMGLIGEATALLGDTDRAARLYEQLLPYDGLVIVVGPRRRRPGVGRPGAGAAGALARPPRRRPAPPRGRGRDGDQDGRPALPGRGPGAAGRGPAGAGSRRQSRARRSSCSPRPSPPPARSGARWIADQALELRLEAQGLAGVDITTSIDDVVSALESEQPDLRAHAAPDGTVAILFSDIEDSTVLTERLGDERWLEVLREHNRVFREQIARHGGYEVKSQGDGFMLAFPDPCEALECAVSVQRAFAERELDDESQRDVAGPDGPPHRRGDRRGGRLLRQERDPGGADRRPGPRRRDPRLGRDARRGRRRQRLRLRPGPRARAQGPRRQPQGLPRRLGGRRARRRPPPTAH